MRILRAPPEAVDRPPDPETPEMDDIFMREIGIFAAVLIIFVGAVPVLIRGHFAEPVEAAAETAVARAGEASGNSGRGKSRRRLARERDEAKTATNT